MMAIGTAPFSNDRPTARTRAESGPKLAKSVISPLQRNPAFCGKKETTRVALSTNEVRDNFSDIVHRVFYAREKIVLTRRGKIFAIFFPPDDDNRLMITEDFSGAGARDALPEIINKVHYAKAIVGIRKKDKLLAVVMSPDVYEEKSRLLSGESLVSWDSIDDTAKRPQEVKTAKGKLPINKPPKI